MLSSMFRAIRASIKDRLHQRAERIARFEKQNAYNHTAGVLLQTWHANISLHNTFLHIYENGVHTDIVELDNFNAGVREACADFKKLVDHAKDGK